MTFVVVFLLGAAAVSLGLRLTSGLVPALSHPIDRLLLAMVVGISVSWLSLMATTRYHVVELGLGLMISLAPVGVYDLARWWYRSRRPPGRWLGGAILVVVLRLLVVAAVLMAFVGALVTLGRPFR